MKFKKFKKMIINVSLLSYVILLSGCDDRVDYYKPTETPKNFENTYEEERTYYDDSSNEIINNTNEDNNITNNTTENNNEKFDNFNSEVNNLDDLYANGSYEKVGAYGKALFIKMVDYIFYGTEINGMTFDELNEESKNEIYKNLRITDSIVMGIDPDYKEKLGEKYNIVKDFSKKKYQDALDLIKDKIGEEKYNEIGEKKNNAIDKTKETGKKLKNNLKNWYEDFRE